METSAESVAENSATVCARSYAAARASATRFSDQTRRASYAVGDTRASAETSSSCVCASESRSRDRYIGRNGKTRDAVKRGNYR
jgi:hypothetical protein